MATPKSVAFHTLGCKLNFAETATFQRQFAERGFSTVDFREEADVVVINTCSVTENADRDARKAVRQALRRSPGAKLITRRRPGSLSLRGSAGRHAIAHATRARLGRASELCDELGHLGAFAKVVHPADLTWFVPAGNKCPVVTIVVAPQRIGCAGNGGRYKIFALETSL